ncbi:MAG: hypothetical protein ACYTXT_40065 [Nostoc sp.]
METADVIVIGSGQGGVPLAADFAKAVRNVVLWAIASRYLQKVALVKTLQIVSLIYLW